MQRDKIIQSIAIMNGMRHSFQLHVYIPITDCCLEIYQISEKCTYDPEDDGNVN